MNIKEKITNSQMLLVGLSEELDLYRKIRKSPEYHAACEYCHTFISSGIFFGE